MKGGHDAPLSVMAATRARLGGNGTLGFQAASRNFQRPVQLPQQDGPAATDGEAVIRRLMERPAGSCQGCIGHVHLHGGPGRLYREAPQPKHIEGRDPGRVDIDTLGAEQA